MRYKSLKLMILVFNEVLRRRGFFFFIHSFGVSLEYWKSFHFNSFSSERLTSCPRATEKQLLNFFLRILSLVSEKK